MKTVLIVDDDSTLLAEQVQAFSKHRSLFEVVTAQNGKAACDILATRPVDVLVTDLEMPVMDGFELLAHVLQEHPGVAIIVMSEYDTETLGVSLEAAGSTELVRKPLAENTLVDRVRSVFAHRARGHISGIALPSFLQLLHLDRRSCTLTVRSGGLRGTLEIFDGEIINALCDGQKGEHAAYTILSWDHPDIDLSGTVHSTHRDIAVSLQHLLIEAARQQDESARNRPMLTPNWLDAPTEPVREPHRLPEGRRAALLAAFQELLMLDGVLGVALVDVRSGVAILSRCRDLTSEFERRAGNVAAVVRSRLQLLEQAQSDEEIDSVTTHLTKHVEILRTFGDISHLVVYLLGARGRLDEQEAMQSLASLHLRTGVEPTAASGE